MRVLRGRCYLFIVCATLCAIVYGIYHLLSKFSSYTSQKESPYRKAFRQHHGGSFYESMFNPTDYPTLPQPTVSEKTLDKTASDDLSTADKFSKLQRRTNNYSSVNKDKTSYKLSNDEGTDKNRKSDSSVLLAGQREKSREHKVSQRNQSTVTEAVFNLRKLRLTGNRTVDAASVLPPSQESMLIKEQRRQAKTKRKRIEEKVWFQQDVADVMKNVREGVVVQVRKTPHDHPGLPVDPKHWEGLNNTFLYHRYPGIQLAPDYIFNRPFFAPNDSQAAGMQGSPQSIEDITDGQAEERFYQLISTNHVDCGLIQRMGNDNDGGWDLCTVKPYNFDPRSCLVYSFGINYDFTFDDAMAAAFNCTVKSFDPSMTVNDYVRSANVYFFRLGLGAENTVTDNGWRLMSLRNIQSKLGHSETIIDVIKIDIEYNEWSCLSAMASDGSLNLVKQLIFEIHTSEVETVQRPSSKVDFVNMYQSLVALEKAGFRRYNYHYNTLGQYTSVRTGKTRSCCYEVYYVNIRFLKE